MYVCTSTESHKARGYKKALTRCEAAGCPSAQKVVFTNKEEESTKLYRAEKGTKIGYMQWRGGRASRDDDEYVGR